MRHDGINFFYDFRQVTPEQLKTDASKLIEVSESSHEDRRRPMIVDYFVRTARLCMTEWRRWRPAR